MSSDTVLLGAEVKLYEEAYVVQTPSCLKADLLCRTLLLRLSSALAGMLFVATRTAEDAHIITVLLIYDLILHLPDEIEVLWHRRNTGVTYLLMATRIVQIFLFLSPVAPTPVNVKAGASHVDEIVTVLMASPVN